MESVTSATHSRHVQLLPGSPHYWEPTVVLAPDALQYRGKRTGFKLIGAVEI